MVISWHVHIIAFGKLKSYVETNVLPSVVTIVSLHAKFINRNMFTIIIVATNKKVDDYAWKTDNSLSILSQRINGQARFKTLDEPTWNFLTRESSLPVFNGYQFR